MLCRNADFNTQNEFWCPTQYTISYTVKTRWNCQKYTKIHRFLCPIWDFWGVFMAFLRSKFFFETFLEKWALEELFQSTENGLFSVFQLGKFWILGGKLGKNVVVTERQIEASKWPNYSFFVYKSQNFSAQYTIIHNTQYTCTIYTNTGSAGGANFFGAFLNFLCTWEFYPSDDPASHILWLVHGRAGAAGCQGCQPGCQKKASWREAPKKSIS